MRLRKILCPVDFSQDSTNAMRLAIRLANEHAAELVLAHVFQLPTAFAMGEPVLPTDVYTTLADESKRGLDQAVAQATELGAKRVTCELRTGVAWAEIIDLLERDATIDLVVMGTHGRSGLSRFLLGSVTEKVVRHAPCSVLTIRADAAVVPFAKILCPIDFSDASEVAMDFAAELHAKSITLLHIIEVIMPYSGEPFPTVYVDEIEERTTEELDRAATLLRKLAEVPVETTSRQGRAGQEVIEALDEDRAFDLVVIGSHGRTGIKRALLGSVAEVVVRHARCPVLVARRRR
jgi:nucleotide-binding universal stress UspA family protein